MTREQQIAAEVAARYGVTVRPSAVQVLPTGASAWAAPVWDGQMLRYPDADKRKKAMQAAHYRRARVGQAMREAQDRPRLTAMQERRAAVRILHGEGLWQSEIARRLAVNYTTIAADHQALGLVPVKAPKEAFNSRRAYEVPPEILARNARIRELAGLGWTAERIGRDVGFSRHVVQAVARKLGIVIARPAPTPKPVKVKARPPSCATGRRAEVKRLIDAGHYTAEIARILKISPRVAQWDVRVLGGCMASGSRGPRRTGARDARRDLVLALHRQGLGETEIAAQVGVHHDTVRLDLRALGVAGMSVEESRVMAVEAIRAGRARREAEMVRLSGQGLLLGDIVQQTGVSESTVRRVLVRHGLMPDRQGMIEARRSEVYRMRMLGATLAQMVAALGVAETTISSDLRALGLADRRENTAARRAEVAQMRAHGATIQQMAAALGVSHSTISVDITAMTLTGDLASPRREAA